MSTRSGVDEQQRRARRWPVLASLAALTLISFVQLPGKTTFDTKLDLAVRPADFLARALRMWNPEATFGELQNQAYGYLFPIGPYFVLMDWLGVPTWIAQRLWCALLLGAAFLGVVLLARALDIGSEPARIIAGLAYALAPRMLTEIGTLSSEMLPAASLPWVLLPLVHVDRLGIRRAAALSALAVLCMSGVNAAMVLMALPLPGVWLLTRKWTRQHAKLVTWWCGCVVLATLWWIIPLLLLGRYSLPFLDYVESAANTTSPLSQFQALRGTNQWVAYVVSGEPWWPAGWTLVDSPALMVATGLIAAISLAGLARRNLPERRFLLLGMVTGLVLLTLGHVGALDSPISAQWRELLDGPLAPFRNVHKFDPVLRLTLALGFAHGAGVAWLSVSRRRLELALTGLLVFAVAAPAWLLMLRPGPGWEEIPAYWKQASGWLAEHNPDHRTLLVPAMGFGEYAWGRTVDEPMQPLAESPWAIRNQIPLGSEGNTRFMDTVESALVNGRGSPALAAYLARAGVKHVLVRNDVYRPKLDVPSLQLIHSALAASPGIAKVRSFGPEVRLDAYRKSSLLDAGRRPALQVYEVTGPIHRVSATAVDDALTVSGGPESVLPLLEQDLLAPDQPAVLAGEPRMRPEGPRVITDGLRRQERNVGRVHDNVSETLAETDPVRQQRPALDLLPLPGQDRLTRADYDGVRAVRASTAASYADAYGSSDPSYLPFSAFDGDPATMWRSSSLVGPVGQWLEVELDTPRVFDKIRLRFADDVRIAWPVSRIRITTDLGSQEHTVPEGTEPHSYSVPPGPTSTIRITVTRMVGDREDGNVGITEVDIPDLEASRSLRAPTAGDGTGVPSLAFTRGADPRPACFAVAGEVRCDPAVVRYGEEPLGVNRRFVLPEKAEYRLSATALPRPGGAPSVPAPGARLEVSATSQLAGDPAVSPYLAMDGDRDTAWLADVTDLDPTLRLRWKGVRDIDRLSLRVPRTPAASKPLEIRLRTLHQTVTVEVPDSGVVTFPTLRTDHLDIDFPVVASRPMDPRAGADGDATVGIAELDVPALAGLAQRPAPGAEMELPCGAGPTLVIDSKEHRTKLVGRYGDLAAYRPLRVEPCDDDVLGEGLTLRPGEHQIRTLPSDRYVAQSLTLRAAGAGAVKVSHRDVAVRDWGATQRELRIAGGAESYLVVSENANAGWVATLNGEPLRPARIDGWQQAWIVPSGAGGTVTLEFAPDRTYRAGLLAGALAVVVLLVAALMPRRRRPESLPRLTAAATGPSAQVALVVLIGLLGGLLPLAALAVCVWLRRRYWNALPVLALSAMAIATAVAVTGRLAGYGQSWALGPWSQAASLIAVAAVAASYVPAVSEVRGFRPDPPRDKPENREVPTATAAR